ncbi:MAG: helix-turn-helix transcriptional regulator [Clostridia bacterium]|nr:helix-turn-helix transcriptional regulator [Clostridia bacterium]
MKYIHRQKGADEMYKTWHSHGEYMIIYTYSSGGSLVTADATYPIKRGALAVIAPGKHHYTMPTMPENYERSKLFISEEELKPCLSLANFFDIAPGGFVYASLPESELEYAECLFEELSRSEGDERYRATLISSIALRLIVLCDKYATDKEMGASDSMTLAIRYVNDNIFEDITLDSVAAAANMSKYHFSRTFKRAVGVTVMEYILKTRIMLSKNLLASSELSILEVSERCGFSSVSYFCRAFKAEVGKTPLGYRKAGN